MLPVSDTPIQHVTFVPNMHNTGRETFCALGNLRSLLVDNDEKLWAGDVGPHETLHNTTRDGHAW